MVLAVASTGKAADRQKVVATVQRYEVLPRQFVRPVAQALVWAEFAVAASLALGFLPSIGAAVAAGMLSAFAAVVVWNLGRGRRFECGCGGTGGSEIGWGLICRDLLLVSVAVMVAVAPVGGLSVWSWPPRHASVPAADLLPVPLGVCLVYCVFRAMQSAFPMRMRPISEAGAHIALPHDTKATKEAM